MITMIAINSVERKPEDTAIAHGPRWKARQLAGQLRQFMTPKSQQAIR